MDTYEYILDNEDTEVFAISLVDRPAIEVDFIALNKEFVMCAADDDQHIVTGVALMPDIPIFRKGKNGEPDFYMTMTADTVKEAAFRFLERSKNQEITLMHDGKVENVSVVESWVTEQNDPKLEKLGIKDIPANSWGVSMRVQNPEVWGMVKEELLKGFSIEGLFKRGEKINLINENVMDEELKKTIEELKTLMSEILNALKPKEEPVEEPVSEPETDLAKDEVTALRSQIEKLSKASANDDIKNQVVELKKQIEDLKLQSVVDFEIKDTPDTDFKGLMKKLQVK